MKDKKALLILIPFLLFVIIIGAFAIVGDRIPDNPPETVGNTAGNLNNSGYFCEYDGKVYFANVYDSDTLYSMDPSEQDIKKLGNASVQNILAGGKFLYYYQTGASGDAGIGALRTVRSFNRCKLNGSDVTGLTRDPISTAQLVGSDLYIMTVDDNGPLFYRMKIEDTVMAQLTGEQRKLYLANQDRIAQQVQHREAGEFKKDKLKVLAELTKLRQICCDPRLHYEDYKAGSAKLDTCMELVHGALDGGHRILLFSQFTGMLDIIGKRLAKEDIAFLKLTGASSKESRAKMVAQFQAGEVPVFLISLKAGGVGLNLTAADVVIHYDPWWNVAAQDQATDRAHRIGQQHTVTVYKLIAKDTIEERIMQMQESKRDLVNSVLGGDGISSALFTREDVLALLGGDGR